MPNPAAAIAEQIPVGLLGAIRQRLRRLRTQIRPSISHFYSPDGHQIVTLSLRPETDPNQLTTVVHALAGWPDDVLQRGSPPTSAVRLPAPPPALSPACIRW